MLSVIIPASNEADHIGGCLDALLEQTGDRAALPETEVIVVANGCTDATASVARSYEERMAARGWRLLVVDLEQGGKLNALNVGDQIASGSVKAYIDGDLLISPLLLFQLWTALDRADPAYAGGRPQVAPGRSWITRAYSRVWVQVPFITDSVPGCGVYAVNAAGRARWDTFPDIISDDIFVRLHFSPDERIGVPASYKFWLAEGFGSLVRVRRRQDNGVAEIARKFPMLMKNEDKPRFTLGRLVRLAAGDPIGFGVYVAVALAVRSYRNRAGERWSRSR